MAYEKLNDKFLKLNGKFITRTLHNNFVYEINVDSLVTYLPTVYPNTYPYTYDFWVKWGDGTVEHYTQTEVDLAIPTHTYVSNGVYRITIFDGVFQKINFAGSTQLINVLSWGDMGYVDFNASFQNCTNLLTANGGTANVMNLVTDTSSMFAGCTSLTSVILPLELPLVTNMDYMFNSCNITSPLVFPSIPSIIYVSSIQNLLYFATFNSIQFLSIYIADLTDAFQSSTINTLILSELPNATDLTRLVVNTNNLTSVTLPVNLPNVIYMRSIFQGCVTLTSVTMPKYIPNLQNIQDGFSNCSSLLSCTLPEYLDNVNNMQSIFLGCTNLTTITLPLNMFNINNIVSVFSECNSLANLINLENFGSTTTEIDASVTFYKTTSLLSISMNAMLARIDIYGDSGTPNGTTSIRLTNTGSTFSSTSPQINIDYCSLDGAALNILFGDLPTVSGKEISIIGNPGIATCDTSIATVKGWTVTV